MCKLCDCRHEEDIEYSNTTHLKVYEIITKYRDHYQEEKIRAEAQEEAMNDLIKNINYGQLKEILENAE